VFFTNLIYFDPALKGFRHLEIKILIIIKYLKTGFHIFKKVHEIDRKFKVKLFVVRV